MNNNIFDARYRCFYGVIDKIHSFDDLADSLHLTVARQKQYDELKKKKKEK